MDNFLELIQVSEVHRYRAIASIHRLRDKVMQPTKASLNVESRTPPMP